MAVTYACYLEGLMNSFVRMVAGLLLLAVCSAVAVVARDLSAEQLGKWGPAFNVGVDRMRRLVCEFYDGFNFGKFIREYPDMRGTVTDLLIGDLFTDRVDKVWQPLESQYPPGKKAPEPWFSGTPVDMADTKQNELILPEGPRP